jgi:opacity protein-like surface antigen
MKIIKYFGLLILLFVSLKGMAQKGLFSSGLFVGLNGSQITGDAMEGFNKGGALLGAFTELNYNEKLKFRMELSFTQKGSARVLNDDGTYGPGKWNKYKVNYIEVPVLADYYFTKRLYATAGIGLGYAVNEKYIDKNDVEDNNFGLAAKTEASILLGAGFKITDQFNLFLRYQSSMYNFSTANNTPLWKIWGERHIGYIHVMTSVGMRYYFGK